MDPPLNCYNTFARPISAQFTAYVGSSDTRSPGVLDWMQICNSCGKVIPMTTPIVSLLTPVWKILSGVKPSQEVLAMT
jgi:hypothetical protein